MLRSSIVRHSRSAVRRAAAADPEAAFKSGANVGSKGYAQMNSKDWFSAAASKVEAMGQPGVTGLQVLGGVLTVYVIWKIGPWW